LARGYGFCGGELFLAIPSAYLIYLSLLTIFWTSDKCYCILFLQESEFRDLPPEVIERLLHRPEDLVQHVEENIRIYKNNMLRLLEDYMADHDQQYLIELDSNQPAPILFKVSSKEFIPKHLNLFATLD
jgi:hypothetical protein